MTVTTRARPGPGEDPRRRRLPFTIYALTGLIALKAALVLVVVVGSSVDAVRPALILSMSPASVDLVRDSAAASWVLLLGAALLSLSVIGILGRRRIGWLLAMVLTGLFVGLDIVGYANGAANHLWMALNILTVFYLNQRDVRIAVGASVDPDADELEDAA
jgi:hypothetical protein